MHQRPPTPHQTTHLRAQAAIGVPATSHHVRAEQPHGHLAQGRPRQGGVERLEGMQLQQGGRGRPAAGHRNRRGINRDSQLVQLSREGAVTCAGPGTGSYGMDVGHACFQTWCQSHAQGAARPTHHQQQSPAVVDQALAPRDAPEVEGHGIGHGVGIGIQLDQLRVLGKPGRLRITRIQARVLQLAQPPTLRSLGLERAILPIAVVLRVPAQVLPGQGQVVQVQDVEVGRGGIPLLGVVIGHGATSLCTGSVATGSRREVSASSAQQHVEIRQTTASRPIDSEALRGSSECDKAAAHQWCGARYSLQP